MRYLFLVGIIGIALVVAFISKKPHQFPSTSKPLQVNSVSASLDTQTPKIPEVVLGDPKAENTVIMYFAPTCGHCAEYEKDELPAVNKEFIQTGKIKFIMRILPFSSLDFAVGKIALFHGMEHFQEWLKLFIENQEQWLEPTFEEEEKKEALLKEKIQTLSQNINIQGDIIRRTLNIQANDELSFVKLFCLEHGWTFEEIETALKENPELEKAFSASHLEALKKDGTPLDFVPAFFVNGELQEDWVKVKSLRAEFEEEALAPTDEPIQTTEEEPVDQPSQPLDHTKSEETEVPEHDLQSQTLPDLAVEE